MQEEHYERLPGGHLGFLSRDSLWLGSDHILLVKDLGYLERYQRYYFRDIQGLTLEPTPRYVRIAVGVGIFALSAVLVALGAVAGIVPDGLGIAAAAIGFFPFVVWVTHLLRGPTCTTTVHTAVKDAPLTALGRHRPARRALSAIAQRVRAVQGDFDWAALNVAPSPDVDGAARKLAPGASPAVPSAEQPVQEAASTERHRALVYLGFVQAGHALSALGVLLGVGATTSIVAYLVVISGVLVVASLVLSRGPRFSRRPAIASLAHVLVVASGVVALYYVAIFRVQLRNPGVINRVELGDVMDLDSPATALVLLFSFLGAAGLTAWSTIVHQRRPR